MVIRTGYRVMMAVMMVVLASTTVFAQKEFNVWCFGDSTGLDFNTTGILPAPLTGTGIYVGEGVASIADRSTGELLFYSNGEIVMNRNHQIMANGTGLKGGYSSVQAALILPMPGDSSRYYIFCVAHEGHVTLPDRGASYSIVDMNGDNGLGAVTVKNIPLIGPTTEKLVGVPHCNGKDFWAIVHTVGDNRFHAFAVTEDGVSTTPVTSRVGDIQREPRNWLAASPNGRMLASSIPSGKLELFDFDPCTGIVSGGRALVERHKGYGLCFSPDNTKLYTLDELGAWVLLQFDLADNDRRHTVATIVPINSSNKGYPGAMQIAPDGKIYCAKLAYEWLGVIDYPNRAGIACGYRDQGIFLNGRRSLWGLPNVVVGMYDAPRPSMKVSDTIVCGCVDVEGSAIGNVTGMRWEFPGGRPLAHEGAGPVRVCYDLPGVYQVRYLVENPFGVRDVVRTIHVQGGNAAVELSVGRYGGAPGEIVEIPLLLRSVAGKVVPDRSYQLKLRFNGTILRPLGIPAEDMRYDGRECVVTLRGSSSGDTLVSLRALVGLGDAAMTPIEVDSVVWSMGCVENPRAMSGEFHPTICREGGARLILDRPLAALKSVRYDGGGDVVEIRYTAGHGALNFLLTDVLGRQAASVMEYPDGDEGVVRINASGLGAGIYFCTLRAETFADHTVPLYLHR